MDNRYQDIVRWAENQFGIKLHSHQMNRIMSKLSTLESEYILKDKSCWDSKSLKQLPFYLELVDAITVQESYFFRDQSLYFFLKDTLLPQILTEKKANGQQEINIWSAGCSNGEEIYSIAILLWELIPELKNWRINLLGTDINPKALEMAQAGCYRNNALRAINPEIKIRYFHQQNNKYYLISAIKDMVKFCFNNLANSDYPKIKFDIIICRNVFIYLTRAAIEHTLENFKKILNENGYLFLGPSDFINYYSHGFKLNTKNSVNFYVPNQLPEKLPQEVVKSDPRPNKPIKSYCEKLQTHSEQLKTIQLHLAKQEFVFSLRLIDRYLTEFGPSALIYQYKAQALISLNDVITAKEYCEKSIALDSLNPISFFFKGLLLIDNGDVPEGEKALRRAIYLKKDFPEAYYHLGLLLLSSGELEAGMKYLKQALQVAKNLPQLKKVLLSNNENMKEFAAAIKKDIKYYEGLSHGSK